MSCRKGLSTMVGRPGYDIKVDLHVHTVSSGHAYSTVEECVRAAAGKGLEAIAIADHGPAVHGSCSYYHFWNMRVLPRRWHDIWLLRSAEANIIDMEGKLDIPDRVLSSLDVVHAGLHAYTGYRGDSVEEHTAAIIGALSHPMVDIIVHPDNPSFPVDMEKVVEAACGEGKALEVNNSSFNYTRDGSAGICREMARIMRGRNCLVAVGSDAHVATFAGEFSQAVEILLETDIAPHSVINYTIERLGDFLISRGKPLHLE